MSNVKLDDMMRKIQGLLATADDPATPPPAAENFRAKAEELMMKYRIEEEDLRSRGDLHVETITPGSKWVPLCPSDSPYLNAYWSMAIYAARHTGCRMTDKWDNVDGTYVLGAMVVGFESDVRYMEMLFTAARIVFASRMEPVVDSSLSDEENVYRLRSAGIERIKIARMMGYGDTNSATAKVTNMYKRACKARGEDAALTGRGTSVQAFKEAYVASFTSELHNRLWRARNAASTGGGELVLANRKADVDEAFYELYPHLRPSDVPATMTTKTRRRSSWTAADERRWARQNSAGGQAGQNAGRRAASEVDLGGRKRKDELR